MTRVCTIAIVVWLVAPAAPAWADSDGYYCVGRNYIAYQFGLAPPPIAPHHLYVIRLGGTPGIGEPAILELPQFQIHGLLCDVQTIQIASHDAIYTVQLDSALRPVRYKKTKWADPRHTPPPFIGRYKNLGGWSRPVNTLVTERVLIAKAPAGHEFFLEIVPKASVSNRCDMEITTRLLEVSPTGQTVGERLLFHGNGARECG